jgi:hypothetical protein
MKKDMPVAAAPAEPRPAPEKPARAESAIDALRKARERAAQDGQGTVKYFYLREKATTFQPLCWAIYSFLKACLILGGSSPLCSSSSFFHSA